MADYITLNEQNFDSVLKENDVVMVDFWATWCGPCRMIAPTVEQVATKNLGKVVVGKVDVDECMSLAKRFGIVSIPTLIYFKKGELVSKTVGVADEEEIQAVLDELV